MLKPFVAPKLSEALQLAFANGVTSPEQIKRGLRLGGLWFITCELPA